VNVRRSERERIRVIEPNAHITTVDATADGYIVSLDAELVGRASMLLGAGRDRVEAVIDPASGIMVLKKPGDRVTRGEPILALHYNDQRRIDEAARLAHSAVAFGATQPEPAPLVRAWVHADGEQSFV